MDTSLNKANISVKKRNWQSKNVDNQQLISLQQKTDLPFIIAKLLLVRGIKSQQAGEYLDPTLRYLLPDPIKLLDMQKASKKLVNVIINKQKIAILGDYDVDGATSCALLARFFKMLKLDVLIYIPDRLIEGYGPNIKAFRELKNQGIELIITVDCGTLAFDALKEAKILGLEIIVVDHHLSAQNLPEAYAIINPNRFDEQQDDCRNLAAVGVSFLLAVAINSELKRNNYFVNQSQPNLLKLLDLVAVGTICDVVPLNGVNRAFVKQGIKVIKQRLNLGIAAICDVAKLIDPVNCYHLGFIIGPRINAGGRIGESSIGAKLLSTEDKLIAQQLAKKLDDYNQERKQIELKVNDEAQAQAALISQDKGLICVASEDWHPGVIGIVASRIKDKYNKPTIVISIDGELAKASCRSIKGIDFGSNIVRAKEAGLLLSGGGHAMAAGFTIERNKIEQLSIFLEDIFAPQVKLLNSNKVYYFEDYLSCNSINHQLVRLIEQLGPFGAGNQEPKFRLTEAILNKAFIVGSKHISCFITHQNHANSIFIKAIAFGAVGTDLGDELLKNIGNSMDFIGYLRFNHFLAKENIEFVIDDLIFNKI